MFVSDNMAICLRSSSVKRSWSLVASDNCDFLLEYCDFSIEQFNILGLSSSDYDLEVYYGC